MKVFSFKQFLEEDDSKAIVQTGINSKGLDNSVTKEIINSRLVAATNHAYLTPYIALGNIARILAYVGIVVPQYTFLDREEGEVVFDAPQFGQVAGVNIDGTPAIPKTQYFIYFSYAMNEDGYYDCFAALVDIDELDNIMDEGEDTDPDEVHNAQKLGEESVNEEDHEDEDKKKVNEEMHPRQKIPNGAFVKVTNSRDSNRHEVVGFEPGEHSAQDTYYTVTHLRKPGSRTKFTRSPPKKYDNPGIPDLPGIPRAAAQIHKLNPSNTTNEEHLHENAKWEKEEGTHMPALNQSGLEAHKDAADWHTGEYLRAKESGDTKKQLFHKRRMEHHLFRDGMIHLMVRDIKEESESIDEGTTKYWNKQKKRSWLRKKGYATSSVDSTSVKNTAALAVRNARDIMKKEESESINEEHLHEMDWEEKQGTSIPHLDQPTLKAHKDAADWHTERYKAAMKYGNTREELFHRRRMDHHNGMVHTMERQGFRDKEEVNEVSSKTLQSYKSKALNQVDDMSKDLRGKYMNQVDPEKLRRRASGIQLSQKKLKGTAKIGATHEEVESIDERKSSDPKGLAYKVTAASHAAHPEWGPADHTKDPKTHFGTAATRSSTLAAVRAIRGNRNFDANNPSHVDAAAKAVHGSPEDHGGKPKGWSQTAMTHSGQTPEQKERRAKLTGPYSGLSDDEKEKDREIVRTVASNIKKK